MEVLEKQKIKTVRKAKLDMSDKRAMLKITAQLDKLGEETLPTIPDTSHKLNIMFMGTLLLDLMEQKNRLATRRQGYIRHYGEISEHVNDELNKQEKLFEDIFEAEKKRLSRLVSRHPISEKLSLIKGFTDYRLGIIMSYVKDIRRFSTPMKLCVYSGCANYANLAINKMNMREMRKWKHENYTGKEEDFTEFGFNMELKQQLYILSESLIKAKGFFYYLYTATKQRISDKAINEGKAILATTANREFIGDKAKVGEYYIVGRKTHSLKSWAHSGASWRIVKILMHLVYYEWCRIEGIPAREPYVKEYLGHKSIIDIDAVLKFEEKQRM